ncbi:hypothetical protein BMI86_10245 [Thioclava sp. DLFJ5-1]|uniref:hypothetical protein n=1 Tax=Thioclava sp. DLFJ5-1 TaxID=1915314 RepID=UPI0009960B86|nr:hypothetical protein [Thioclava sp. DLFJ5-1]OOY20877.1 hypothetical protein BMI86_10245 [Thioclava sp. DLFJ5-1]
MRDFSEATRPQLAPFDGEAKLTIEPAPNGGWLVYENPVPSVPELTKDAASAYQCAGSAIFHRPVQPSSQPELTIAEPQLIGAFSNADDLIDALSLSLAPHRITQSEERMSWGIDLASGEDRAVWAIHSRQCGKQAAKARAAEQDAPYPPPHDEAQWPASLLERARVNEQPYEADGVKTADTTPLEVVPLCHVQVVEKQLRASFSEVVRASERLERVIEVGDGATLHTAYQRLNEWVQTHARLLSTAFETTPKRT